MPENPNPLLRPWQMFCPRRFDLQAPTQQQRGPGNTPLLGSAQRVIGYPQVHDWRQEMGVITIAPKAVPGVDETPADTAEREARQTHVLGHAGFYCTRCLARQDEQAMLAWPGDAEEMAAMGEHMTGLQAQREAAAAAAAAGTPTEETPTEGDAQ